MESIRSRFRAAHGGILVRVKHYFWQLAAQSGLQHVAQAGELGEQQAPDVLPAVARARLASPFKALVAELVVLQQSVQLSWQQAAQSSRHFTQSTQHSGPQSAQPLQQAALASFALSLA